VLGSDHTLWVALLLEDMAADDPKTKVKVQWYQKVTGKEGKCTVCVP
jgi:hypothetical protein